MQAIRRKDDAEDVRKKKWLRLACRSLREPPYKTSERDSLWLRFPLTMSTGHQTTYTRMLHSKDLRIHSLYHIASRV